MDQDSRKSLSMEYNEIAANLLNLGKRNRMKPRRFRETDERRKRENGEFMPMRRPDDAYMVSKGLDGSSESDYYDEEVDEDDEDGEDGEDGKWWGQTQEEERDQDDDDPDPAAHTDAWVCTVCRRAFTSSKGLKVHKSWRHPDPGQLPHLPHHHHHSHPQPTTTATTSPATAPAASKKRKYGRSAPNHNHNNNHSNNHNNHPVPPPPMANATDDDEVDELEVITQLANLQRQKAKLAALPYPAPDSPSKKAKQDNEEQRLAKWREKPSQAVRDRIERAVVQRMYLISRADKTDLEKEFVVLGSLGNLYTVTISHRPRCTCPDFEKGSLCNHILFVYLKVLRLPAGSQLVYQSALLTDELYEIFSNAPVNPTSDAAADSLRAQQMYKALVKGTDTLKRRPITGHCPICYEEINAKEELVWCEMGCGNNVHAGCFQQWVSAQLDKNDAEVPATVRCVYCRGPWLPKDITSKTPTNDGFVNVPNYKTGIPTEAGWDQYPKRSGVPWYC